MKIRITRINFLMSRTKFAISRMVKTLSTTIDLPIYFLLFSVFPILFLYSTNIEEVALIHTLIPAAISIISSTTFFLFLNLVFKNIYKSALITSLGFIMFFSYGHIFDLVEGFKIFDVTLGRNKVLFSVFVVLFFIFTIFVVRTRVNFQRAAKTLNIIALILIVISLGNIVVFSTKNRITLSDSSDVNVNKKIVATKNDFSKKPDIYYIILDGYAGEETLKKVYGFNNQPFLNKLRKKGFYIAEKSKSNYPLTLLSLGSSMGMSYFDYLADKSLGDVVKRRRAYESIRNGKVPRFLKSKGYAFISIGTGWSGTDNNPYADYLLRYQQRNEFNKLLYRTTMLLLLEKYQNDAANSILFAFDKVEEIASIEGSTFTFAHIISPHPPYLFDRNGNILHQQSKDIGIFKLWKQKNLYTEQLLYINKRTLTMVDVLLSKSKIDPIVVIQSDHGSTTLDQFFTDLDDLTSDQLEERLEILNVYHLPNGGNSELYDNISPVNSFRRILNIYFRAGLRYLEDKSYFTGYKNFHKSVIMPH